MTEAYPLQWPEGWPRTPALDRMDDRRFWAAGSKVVGFGGLRESRGLNPGRTRDQLIWELERLKAKDVVISSNVALRRDGLPYAEQRRLDDPGVAVYFALKKRPLVMARDQFNSVAGNMRSLTLAIEAIRQLERHGGSAMMERAFTGFVAIAPPSWKKPWRQVFSLPPDWTGTAEDITKVFREKARERHPDAGGHDTLMAELNLAYEEAKGEIR